MINKLLCNVVLSSQVNPPFDGNIVLGMNSACLHYYEGVSIDEECSPQHLYLTSSELINDNDWCYIEDKDLVAQCDDWDAFKKGNPNAIAKRIEASTDNVLNLPTIPNWFIKDYINEYNFENKIEQVYLEVIKPSLKEAIIHLIKDYWNKEEVINVLASYIQEQNNSEHDHANPIDHEEAVEIANNWLKERKY